MKVLVTGGRERADAWRVATELHKLLPFSHLIEGGARGADALAAQWAERIGVQSVTCSANWNKFGKGAGAIRNGNMLGLLSDGDVVIAFPGGTGTANMVKQAINSKIALTIKEVA